MSRRLSTTVLAVALALALSGCGKKPKTVDRLDSPGQAPFPQTYPNPALDPVPGQTSPAPSSGLKFP